MDQYEESKGKNFNPYVFRERYHNVTRDPGPNMESKSPYFQKSLDGKNKNSIMDRDDNFFESDEFARTVLHSINNNDNDNDDAAAADGSNAHADPSSRRERESERGQDGSNGNSNGNGSGSGKIHYSSVSPPTTVTADRYVFWESIGNTNGTGERVIRTYEDVTLTDTSRYVLS